MKGLINKVAFDLKPKSWGVSIYKKNWEENIQGKKASNKFEVMSDFLGLLNFCDDQSKKKDHFYINVFI